MKKQARQGDVLITKTEGKPAGKPVPPEEGRNVLAHGYYNSHRCDREAIEGMTLCLEHTDKDGLLYLADERKAQAVEDVIAWLERRQAWHLSAKHPVEFREVGKILRQLRQGAAKGAAGRKG